MQRGFIPFISQFKIGNVLDPFLKARLLSFPTNPPKKEIPHFSPLCKSLFLKFRPIFYFLSSLVLENCWFPPFPWNYLVLSKWPHWVCPWSLCSCPMYRQNFLLFNCSFDSLNAFIHLQWQIESIVALWGKCFSNYFPQLSNLLVLLIMGIWPKCSLNLENT